MQVDETSDAVAREQKLDEALQRIAARDASKKFSPVTAPEFLARATEKPRWAVENIWPEGAMGVIGGAPKNGKSSLALELAVSLATGTPFLALRDKFRTAGGAVPVLYVQVENSPGRVQRDLQAILEARGLGYLDEQVIGVDVQLEDPADPESKLVEREIVATQFRPLDETLVARLHVLSNQPLVLEDEKHQAWIEQYVREHGIRYVFLDPLYMLTGLDYEQKPASIRPLLNFFTRLKAEQNCAAVLTHHQTAKHTNGSSASRLLGATYIYGWYEAALFTKRIDTTFTLEVDSLRELGVEEKYTLTGEGLGRWSFDEHAQDKKDSIGRQSPAAAKKETQVTKLGQLLTDNPDATRKELAAALGVTERTVSDYRAALAERDEG